MKPTLKPTPAIHCHEISGELMQNVWKAVSTKARDNPQRFMCHIPQAAITRKVGSENITQLPCGPWLNMKADVTPCNKSSAAITRAKSM